MPEPTNNLKFGLTAADRCAELLDCLRRAFREETLDFEGQYFQASGVPLPVKPRQRPHPPLWYAVLTPEIADRGANYLVCRFAFGDLALREMIASVELFAAEVMPRLQQEAARRAQAA